MHNYIKPVLLAVALATGSASAIASDVNFGVSVGGEVAPGVYGRVDIGNTRPALVYAQPVVIVPPPRPMRPIYMNVPPGHAKKWSKHCHRYNACNQPVYFVKTAEYGGYDAGRGGNGKHHDDHRGDHRNDHRDDHRGDRHGHKDDGHHGKGNGNGNGNGKGHGHKHKD